MPYTDTLPPAREKRVIAFVESNPLCHSSDVVRELRLRSGLDSRDLVREAITTLRVSGRLVADSAGRLTVA